MEKKVIDNYMKAGSILTEVKDDLKGMMKPGMKILDIANSGEGMIRKKGGLPAFPINVSINEIAAHYTPRHNDDREVKEGELVKVDIGVHVDGYIVDSAFTYCSEKNEMIACAESVVDEVVWISRPGTTVGEIGGFIEDFVGKKGFGLIVNLTGHGLERFSHHAQPTIPNVSNVSTHELKDGDVIAIEPFITKSKGVVKNTSIVEIYNYLQDRPVRLPEARAILDLAKNEYGGLPFAKRWLCERFSPLKVSLALRQLESVNAIGTHPVLREAGNKPSAQAEHTIIVGEKPIVLSRME